MFRIALSRIFGALHKIEANDEKWLILGRFGSKAMTIMARTTLVTGRRGYLWFADASAVLQIPGSLADVEFAAGY